MVCRAAAVKSSERATSSFLLPYSCIRFWRETACSALNPFQSAPAGKPRCGEPNSTNPKPLSACKGWSFHPHDFANPSLVTDPATWYGRLTHHCAKLLQRSTGQLAQPRTHNRCSQHTSLRCLKVLHNSLPRICMGGVLGVLLNIMCLLTDTSCTDAVPRWYDRNQALVQGRDA